MPKKRGTPRVCRSEGSYQALPETVEDGALGAHTSVDDPADTGPATTPISALRDWFGARGLVSEAVGLPVAQNRPHGSPAGILREPPLSSLGTLLAPSPATGGRERERSGSGAPADRPEGPVLGKYTNNSEAECEEAARQAVEREIKRQATRRHRYQLQGKIRIDPATKDIGKAERLAGCSWRSISAGGQVGMRRNASGGGSGFSGVLRCGSVWSCPVCAAKIARERADELQKVLTWCVRNDHTTAFITFTGQHNIRHELAPLWDAIQGGWEDVNDSWLMRGEYPSAYKKRLDHFYARQGMPGARTTPPVRTIGWAERNGLLGWVRAVECTRSCENGWHPHLHVIMVFEGQRSSEGVEAAVSELFTPWQRSLQKNGFDAKETWRNSDGSLGGAVFVRTSTDAVREGLAEYFTKFAALELTASINKKGHGKGKTHWQLADSAFNDGDWDDLMAWREWQRVSHGRKQLTWSQGLRSLAGLAEKERSDEEIAEEENGDDDVIILSADTWREVRGIQTDLLDVFDRGGIAAAAAWLDARGLEWFPAVKRSDESTNQRLNGTNAPPA